MIGQSILSAREEDLIGVRLANVSIIASLLWPAGERNGHAITMRTRYRKRAHFE